MNIFNLILGLYALFMAMVPPSVKVTLFRIGISPPNTTLNDTSLAINIPIIHSPTNSTPSSHGSPGTLSPLIATPVTPQATAHKKLEYTLISWTPREAHPSSKFTTISKRTLERIMAMGQSDDFILLESPCGSKYAILPSGEEFYEIGSMAETFIDWLLTVIKSVLDGCTTAGKLINTYGSALLKKFIAMLRDSILPNMGSFVTAWMKSIIGDPFEEWKQAMLSELRKEAMIREQRERFTQVRHDWEMSYMRAEVTRVKSHHDSEMVAAQDKMMRMKHQHASEMATQRSEAKTNEHEQRIHHEWEMTNLWYEMNKTKQELQSAKSPFGGLRADEVLKDVKWKNKISKKAYDDFFNDVDSGIDHPKHAIRANNKDSEDSQGVSNPIIASQKFAQADQEDETATFRAPYPIPGRLLEHMIFQMVHEVCSIVWEGISQAVSMLREAARLGNSEDASSLTEYLLPAEQSVIGKETENKSLELDCRNEEFDNHLGPCFFAEWKEESLVRETTCEVPLTNSKITSDDLQASKDMRESSLALGCDESLEHCLAVYRQRKHVTEVHMVQKNVAAAKPLIQDEECAEAPLVYGDLQELEDLSEIEEPLDPSFFAEWKQKRPGLATKAKFLETYASEPTPSIPAGPTTIATQPESKFYCPARAGAATPTFIVARSTQTSLTTRNFTLVKLDGPPLPQPVTLQEAVEYHCWLLWNLIRLFAVLLLSKIVLLLLGVVLLLSDTAILWLRALARSQHPNFFAEIPIVGSQSEPKQEQASEPSEAAGLSTTEVKVKTSYTVSQIEPEPKQTLESSKTANPFIPKDEVKTSQEKELVAELTSHETRSGTSPRNVSHDGSNRSFEDALDAMPSFIFYDSDEVDVDENEDDPSFTSDPAAVDAREAVDGKEDSDLDPMQTSPPDDDSDDDSDHDDKLSTMPNPIAVAVREATDGIGSLIPSYVPPSAPDVDNEDNLKEGPVVPAPVADSVPLSARNIDNGDNSEEDPVESVLVSDSIAVASEEPTDESENLSSAQEAAATGILRGELVEPHSANGASSYDYELDDNDTEEDDGDIESFSPSNPVVLANEEAIDTKETFLVVQEAGAASPQEGEKGEVLMATITSNDDHDFATYDRAIAHTVEDERFAIEQPMPEQPTPFLSLAPTDPTSHDSTPRAETKEAATMAMHGGGRNSEVHHLDSEEVAHPSLVPLFNLATGDPTTDASASDAELMEIHAATITLNGEDDLSTPDSFEDQRVDIDELTPQQSISSLDFPAIDPSSDASTSDAQPVVTHADTMTPNDDHDLTIADDEDERSSIEERAPSQPEEAQSLSSGSTEPTSDARILHEETRETYVTPISMEDRASRDNNEGQRSDIGEVISSYSMEVPSLSLAIGNTTPDASFLHEETMKDQATTTLNGQDILATPDVFEGQRFDMEDLNLQPMEVQQSNLSAGDPTSDNSTSDPQAMEIESSSLAVSEDFLTRNPSTSDEQPMEIESLSLFTNEDPAIGQSSAPDEQPMEIEPSSLAMRELGNYDSTFDEQLMEFDMSSPVAHELTSDSSNSDEQPMELESSALIMGHRLNTPNQGPMSSQSEEPLHFNSIPTPQLPRGLLFRNPGLQEPSNFDFRAIQERQHGRQTSIPSSMDVDEQPREISNIFVPDSYRVRDDIYSVTSSIPEMSDDAMGEEFPDVIMEVEKRPDDSMGNQDTLMSGDESTDSQLFQDGYDHDILMTGVADLRVWEDEQGEGDSQRELDAIMDDGESADEMAVDSDLDEEEFEDVPMGDPTQPATQCDMDFSSDQVKVTHNSSLDSQSPTDPTSSMGDAQGVTAEAASPPPADTQVEVTPEELEAAAYGVFADLERLALDSVNEMGFCRLSLAFRQMVRNTILSGIAERRRLPDADDIELRALRCVELTIDQLLRDHYPASNEATLPDEDDHGSQHYDPSLCGNGAPSLVEFDHAAHQGVAGPGLSYLLFCPGPAPSPTYPSQASTPAYESGIYEKNPGTTDLPQSNSPFSIHTSPRFDPLKFSQQQVGNAFAPARHTGPISDRLSTIPLVGLGSSDSDENEEFEEPGVETDIPAIQPAAQINCPCPTLATSPRRSRSQLPSVITTVTDAILKSHKRSSSDVEESPEGDNAPIKKSRLDDTLTLTSMMQNASILAGHKVRETQIQGPQLQESQRQEPLMVEEPQIQKETQMAEAQLQDGSDSSSIQHQSPDLAEHAQYQEERNNESERLSPTLKSILKRPGQASRQKQVNFRYPLNSVKRFTRNQIVEKPKPTPNARRSLQEPGLPAAATDPNPTDSPNAAPNAPSPTSDELPPSRNASAVTSSTALGLKPGKRFFETSSRLGTKRRDDSSDEEATEKPTPRPIKLPCTEHRKRLAGTIFEDDASSEDSDQSDTPVANIRRVPRLAQPVETPPQQQTDNHDVNIEDSNKNSGSPNLSASPTARRLRLSILLSPRRPPQGRYFDIPSSTAKRSSSETTDLYREELEAKRVKFKMEEEEKALAEAFGKVEIEKTDVAGEKGKEGEKDEKGDERMN